MGNEVMCLVKKIPLTQGQFALVDDEDYENLNQWKWHAIFKPGVNNYYAGGKLGLMHRLLMNAPSGLEVDHINHNTLDNRKENLRVVTRRQNAQNKLRKGTSKYIGVWWNSRQKKWQSRIQVQNVLTHLGFFDSEEEAHEAYKQAVHELANERLIYELNE